MTIFTGDELSALSFAVQALGASATAALLALLLASRADALGLVSRRRTERFSGRRVPLTGGVGLLVGGALALVALRAGLPASFVCAAVGFFGVGLWDDLAEPRPLAKLLVQTGVALVVLLVQSGRPEVLGTGLVVYLFLVNGSNYLDNMDGLLAGVALTQATALALFGTGAGPGPLLLVWALPGVLLLNVAPARVYLGDSGSHLVGACLAHESVRQVFGGPEPRYDRIFPLLLCFAVIVADVAVVTISRRLRGRPVFRGGLDHISHRLVRAGATVRGAVLVLVLGSAACCAASLFLVHS